jgi:DNA repair protein RadD
MKLRPYQHEAVDSIFEYFSNHGGTDHVTGFPIRANPIVAMQTGLGKSIVIAEFIRRSLQYYPNTRGLMAVHVHELISQNYNKIKEIWPQCPIGIYSASLNKKDSFQPIIYGGVRSVVGKFPMFGYRDYLIVDETHLVNPDAETSYMKLIWELQYGEYVKPGQKPTKEQFQKALDNPNCNPYLKVIGFSASPFRSGLGMLTNGPIFTDFCYNSCNMEGWSQMLAQGYLAPLHPKPTRTTLDVSGIKIQNGEFNQAELQAKIDKKDINQRCLLELLEHSVGKKCGLIFASGIEHAEHLADLMNNLFNEECVLVHSGNKDYPRTKAQNEESLKLWKSGKVKWAVNVNALTTGVDKPELDIIGMLRPTMSSALWIQMLGRGTRPAEGKAACVVLDFAGNTPRNGPVNDPIIPRMKRAGGDGEMPVKICQKCGTYNHARAVECLACGEPFPVNTKLTSVASSQALMRGEMPIVETFNVLRVVYTSYKQKVTERPMIKVAYHCDRLKTFFENITVEVKSPGAKMDYPVKLGRDWFRQRHHIEPPLLNETVLLMSDQLRVPVRVNVWLNKPGTTLGHVLGVEF